MSSIQACIKYLLCINVFRCNKAVVVMIYWLCNCLLYIMGLVLLTTIAIYYLFEQKRNKMLTSIFGGISLSFYIEYIISVVLQ